MIVKPIINYEIKKKTKTKLYFNILGTGMKNNKFNLKPKVYFT